MGQPDEPEATEPASETPKPDEETKPELSPPTRRSNVRLMVAIGLAVAVLGGGGATIVALANIERPEDIALQQARTEARAVAERFAALFEQARNDGAFALSKSDVKALLCAQEQDALDQEWQERENKEIARSNTPSSAPRLAMTVKDVRIDGERGVFTLVGAQADRRTDQDFDLVKEEAQWKVCGLTFRTPKTTGRTTSPTTTEPFVPTDTPSETPSGTPTMTPPATWPSL